MKNGVTNPELSRELEPELVFSVDSATSASSRHPEENQDAVLGEHEKELAPKLEQLSVYGVLDGVSSADGAASSRESSAVVAAKLAELPPEADAEQTKRAFREALLEADAALGKDGKKASTADLVRLLDSEDGGQELVWAHVGDSRIMVLDGESGELRTLTVDDGPAGEALKNGDISQEEYDSVMSATSADELPANLHQLYKWRHALTNALGTPRECRVSTGSEKLPPGSKVLLSSDGIHDNLTPEEIRQMLADDAPVEEIRQKAFERAQASERKFDLEEIIKNTNKNGNLKKRHDLTEGQLELYRQFGGERDKVWQEIGRLANEDPLIERGKPDDITGVLITLEGGKERPAGEKTQVDLKIPAAMMEARLHDSREAVDALTGLEQAIEAGSGLSEDENRLLSEFESPEDLKREIMEKRIEAAAAEIALLQRQLSGQETADQPEEIKKRLADLEKQRQEMVRQRKQDQNGHDKDALDRARESL